MKKITMFWIILAFLMLVIINFASVLQALSKDPQVNFNRVSSAEVIEGYPLLFTERGKDVYEIKYEVFLHDVNDTFVMTIDSYYEDKYSILFSNQQDNPSPARVELQGMFRKGGKLNFQYKAKYDNDFYYILIRFKLSENQMFVRKNLGRDINLTFVNIPFFFAMLISIWQVEKTSAKIPELFERGTCKKCKEKRKYLGKKGICVNCLILEGMYELVHETPKLSELQPLKVEKQRKKLKIVKIIAMSLFLLIIGFLTFIIIKILFSGS